MAINWGDIYSRKVRDLFRVALSDRRLDHAEVVDILQELLMDGSLSGVEVNDLQKIATNSETIEPQTKHLLLNLGFEVYRLLRYSPFYYSTDRQKYAVKLICEFLKRRHAQSFSKLDRARVGIDLLLRVANPSIIDQENAGLCGPVAFLYGVAFDSPAAYAKFAIDLFENGRGKIGRFDVRPSKDCRNYQVEHPMAQADWITAGGLRDSENFLLDYDGVDRNWFADGATNGEVARWFSKAGYTDIHSDDNLFSSRGASDIDKINNFYNNGYRIVLRINSKVLKKAKQSESSWRGNHFVVLRSPIRVDNDQVKLTVYTWGNGLHHIPAAGTTLSPGGFREHWYGYVAAKPF